MIYLDYNSSIKSLFKQVFHRLNLRCSQFVVLEHFYTKFNIDMFMISSMKYHNNVFSVDSMLMDFLGTK